MTWAVFGDSIQENGTVAHIGELFDAAKAAGIADVAVSPHYFCPPTQWKFGDPLEKFMDGVNMFGQWGPYTLDSWRASGADFLPTTHRIHDGQTVIASPRKIISRIACSCNCASAA